MTTKTSSKQQQTRNQNVEWHSKLTAYLFYLYLGCFCIAAIVTGYSTMGLKSTPSFSVLWILQAIASLSVLIVLLVSFFVKQNHKKSPAD